MIRPPTILTSLNSYWLHWGRLNWIAKNAAALRRRLAVRGQRGGGLRRLGQAASAFALAASMLFGALPRPALATSTPGFVLSTSTAPFGLTNVGLSSTPAFADIDADGDLDAFIGEKAGNLNFFRNTGTVVAPAFVDSGSSAPFGLSNVGGFSGPVLVDLDHDGDLDALVGNDGNTRYFQNTGNATAPGFVLATSTAPFGLAAPGSSLMPAFADLNGDGDLDAVIGQYTLSDSGLLTYHSNNGTALAPVFAAALSNAFGLNVVGDAFPAPALADIDGDGDLDAVVGGYSGNLQFFTNSGTAVAPAFAASVLNPFGLSDVGSYSAPTFADIDGDGDLDAFAGEYDGFVNFYRNTGFAAPPAFLAPPSANPFGLVDIGDISAPTFGDLDSNGTQDMLVGDTSGNFVYFRNSGTAVAPAFAASTVNPFGLAGLGNDVVPAFADLDHDGDLDLLAGAPDGTFRYFKNTGTAIAPLFSASTTLPGLINMGTFAAPTFADLDGNGKLEVLAGESDGTLNIFLNTGTALAPAFIVLDLPPDIGTFTTPTAVDIDGDGDKDVMFGQLDGSLNFLRNSGHAASWNFAEAPVTNPFSLADVGGFSTPAFVDINGDGRLDGFSGESSGNIFYFKGLGSIFLPLALKN